MAVSSSFDSSNPLIAPPDLPFGAPPLDVLREEHYLPALSYALEKARGEIKALRENPEAPSFENTIEALTFSGEDLSRIAETFHVIAASATNDKIREIEETFDVETTRFSSEISLDPVLFARVKEVYDARAGLSLSDEGKLLLEETYKSFVRSGALLDEGKKERVRAINEELARLSTLYSNNLVRATKAWRKIVEDEAELEGLPERVKALYKRNATEAGFDGKFLILLEPMPIEIYTHATKRALREEVYRALSGLCSAGPLDNREVLMKIVRLRHERAALLGFATHAAFVLDDRMAGSPETVKAFLEKNLSVYKKAATKEIEELRAYAREKDGLEALKPWDLPYYARCLKEERFSFSEEVLRPFFEVERVFEGLCAHVEKLFGVLLRDGAGKYPVYATDVHPYELVDKASGRVIGIFYRDYVARAGAKRGGAWESTLRERGLHNGRDEIPIVFNNCNFPRPSEGHPTLLSLRDVETVFHEFGHALHGLLAKAHYPALAGTNVKWDFVELPSQVQENWVYEKETLDRFARNIETGDLLPASLIEILKAVKKFHAGRAGLGQTYYALLDMAYYGDVPQADATAESIEKPVEARAAPMPREEGLMSCVFDHIFGGGYDAGYYSYKWAEALDADVFSAFVEHGLYDPETAARLKALYEAGGTVPPMVLFERMRGRGPDPEALFRREGLLEDKQAGAHA